mgnify:CR=1 FL=1
MISNNTITVNQESNKQRLDIFLSAQLDITRSQAQKLIKQDLVTIDNKLPKKAGDKIILGQKIEIKKKVVKKIQKKEIKKTIKKKITGVKIVNETDSYLIINKPANLLTHEAENNDSPALTNYLTKKYPEIKGVGEYKDRPGIVHRLDKEASGLMVVAKTQKIFKHLKKQFQNRTVEKEYFVLVHGKIEADYDKINFPLKRSKNTDRIAAIPTTNRGIMTDQGRDALTEFWVEQRFINFTLLRVKIHTGRMHQIRVHMLAYNHPVVGDKVYYQKKQSRKYDKILDRLFLHCTKLGFTDLKKEKQTFEIKLPKKLQDFLKIVK